MNSGYFTAEACKNTFVLYDRLNLKEVDDNLFKLVHANLMKEDKDDALILIDGKIKGKDFYAKMIVLGQDATFGEFCGNGSRVCANYLFSKYQDMENFYLVSNLGIMKMYKYENNIYAIDLPLVRFVINEKFIAKKELFEKEDEFYFIKLEGKKFYYAEAIEPHLVLQEKVSDKELFELGQKLNQRKDIFPNGININACDIVEENLLKVKTYERGVQRLTQSCGTGSSSSCAIYLKGKKNKVKVQTPGGLLEITLKDNSIELKGPANIEIYKE